MAEIKLKNKTDLQFVFLYCKCPLISIHVFLQLVFEGVIGNGYQADIALDDVSLAPGACTLPGGRKFSSHFDLIVFALRVYWIVLLYSALSLFHILHKHTSVNCLEIWCKNKISAFVFQGTSMVWIIFNCYIFFVCYHFLFQKQNHIFFFIFFNKHEKNMLEKSLHMSLCVFGWLLLSNEHYIKCNRFRFQEIVILSRDFAHGQTQQLGMILIG